MIIAQAAQAVAGGDPTGVLVQYGALGVFLIITLGVVKVLFGRETKTLDLERQRADRLEAELRALNAAMTDKIIPVLTAATHAMSEMLDRERR